MTATIVLVNEFEKRYQALNNNQKKAVDTIDGPVMVVAGPGTGKTELLSVRTAHILQQTDVLPQNILCLTFTDSGAIAMRERLAGLLGHDAYKVAIYTFHSFGTEIINQYSDFFYEGAQFKPADAVSSYEIVSTILRRLPHSNPLSKKMNDRFTYLGDIQRTIAELKRGGLSPDEVTAILERNKAFLAWCNPQLASIFRDRLSKKTVQVARAFLDTLATYHDEPLAIPNYHTLRDSIAHSLARAIDATETHNSTTPLTAWKNTYLEKDNHDEFVLKDVKRGHILEAVSDVYSQYLTAMNVAELYDYDDMILRVVHALEHHDDLRFSLQEQYQYIMIDEFQDTNDAQMRLIWNMTNNPVSEGAPNLLVVGDDDQAIYRFQGADVSNIIDFKKRYANVTVVALTDNYRSTKPILDTARDVIVQGTERLETLLGVSKQLTPHRSNDQQPHVTAITYDTPSHSYTMLAETIQRRLKDTPTKTHAVIARHHKELQALLPHLAHHAVIARYEQQENILESEPIQQLECVARVVDSIARSDFDNVNASLPQLLAHPAWDIPARDLWELSLEAYRDKKYWLEKMLTMNEQLQAIAEWLIVGSEYAKHKPLEYVLDYLFGISSLDTVRSSPYKDYFFSIDKLDTAYIAHLTALQKIRSMLRDYQPHNTLMLKDFLHYIQLYRDLNLGITATNEHGSDSPVTLLTAHKAKGLEFDYVYIIDTHESVWGSSARAHSRHITFPSNMALSPSSDTDNERLRLLYVALTRARDELTLISAQTDEQGKKLLPVGALDHITFVQQPPLDDQRLIVAAETSWSAPLLNVPQRDRLALLHPRLRRYRLSATHLNNFLDVRKDGPSYFLLYNLLRLPEAMSPSFAYGLAMHTSLQRAHQYVSRTGNKQPIEDIVHGFEVLMRESRLPKEEYDAYTVRGAQALTTFLEQHYDSFTPNQIVERAFTTEPATPHDAHLNGVIDLLDIDHDEKTIFITDYKTGKPARTWRGRDELEKIKLHHYEKQLMTYKLLIEQSRQFHNYTVTGAAIVFVEPDERGVIVRLEYTYDTDKLALCTQLITAVWRHVTEADFPSTTDYEPNYRGIVAFERDLVSQLTAH